MKPKPSEIIRLAVANHYARDYENGKTDKSIFMCHAIIKVRDSLYPELKHVAYLSEKDKEVLDLFDSVSETFMTEITSKKWSTLANYLKVTDKKYNTYCRRWGHSSKACFKLRLAFWENHIAELESKGL